MKHVVTRRTLLGFTGGLAAAAVLGACGSKDSGSDGPTSAMVDAPTADGSAVAASCSAGAWTQTFPTGFKKYDPPIKVNVAWQSSNDFLPGDSFTKNPMYDRLKNTLGIEYVPKFQADTTVWSQKLSQAIVSGDLPDTFPLEGADLAGLIDNDGAEEIKEIWEATASDLVKTKREYPAGKGWTVSSRGDKLYGIPYINGPAYNVDCIGYIRQDLLEKIGAEMPKTVTELGAAVKEMHDQKLVDYGFASCQKINTYATSLDPIFAAHGVVPKVWSSYGGSDLQYGGIQPQIKDALTVLAQWYKEGLMDPDFYTKTVQDAEVLMTSGKQAVTFNPFWTATKLSTNEQERPGTKWAIMGNPTGPDGKAGRAGSSMVDGAVVFKAGTDRQKIEAVINQLNWSTEMHVNWTKYKQYGEFNNSSAWTEGYNYELDGCNITEGKVITQYKYLNFVAFNYPQISYPAYQSDVYGDIAEWAKTDKSKLDLSQQLLSSNTGLLRNIEAYDYVFSTKDQSITSEFLGSATKTMIAKSGDLEQLQLEAYTKIIVGKEPLSSFDDFVAKWKAGGGDDITKEVNEWKQQQG